MSGYTQVLQEGDYDNKPAPYGQHQQQPYGQPAPYGQQQQPYGQPAPFVQQQPYGQPALYDQQPYAHSTKEERFPEQLQFRDLPFLAIFLAHLVVTIIIFGVGFGRYRNLSNGVNGADFAESGSNSGSIDGSFGKGFGTSVILCALFGGIFSVLWIFLLRKFSNLVVHLSIIGALALYVVAAIVYFALGQPAVAVVFLVVGAINLLVIFCWRSRIAFAREVLKCVVDIIDQFPAPVWVSICSIVPMWLWCFFWIFTFIFASFIGSSSTVNIILYIYLLLSYFWTTQVIKNVVHVTAAGVFASWYFLAGNMPRNPTLAALKRAVSTSFGSICLGSLLVAVIKTLKALVSRNGGLLGCILGCFLSIIDSLVQYFNRYAFAQVAIYGKTFCQSAKSTWSMFAEHGFEAIINDDITGMVLTMGCLVCGLFTGLAGGLLAAALSGGDGFSGWAVAFIGFIIGFSICLLTMEVIDAGVATIFVCFVEEPERLRETNPHFYQKFSEAYGDKCSLFHHHA